LLPVAIGCPVWLGSTGVAGDVGRTWGGPERVAARRVRPTWRNKGLELEIAC